MSAVPAPVFFIATSSEPEEPEPEDVLGLDDEIVWVRLSLRSGEPGRWVPVPRAKLAALLAMPEIFEGK